jgi:4-alpha-glucanotransferase
LRLKVLPVNDTSVYGMWWDSYPYNSISVFALHPMYLSLSAIFKGPLGPPTAELAAFMQAAKAEADMSKDVDYEATMRNKLAVARSIFASPQGCGCA